jgi:aspartate kinase
MNTLIMKFGGAATATPQHFSHVADLIIERRLFFPRIVVVVSAMEGATNQLIDLAHQVHPSPPQRELDMLVSVGERVSMSLLAMALCAKNQSAISFTGSQSGIVTCSRHTNAQIIDVKPQRIQSNLEKGKIVIVAGFQGVSHEKEITTLGRGGSDTSAVALGIALEAMHVEFYKDVPGVFSHDPKKFQEATCFEILDYESALMIVNQGAKVLHPRAIELAAKNGLPLHVRSFISSYQDHPGTMICTNRKREKYPLFEEIHPK